MSQVDYSQVLSKSMMRGPDAVKASVDMHDPNVKHLAVFLGVMSMGMLASKSGDYMNVCTHLLENKYNWETQSAKDLNEALMNTIPAVGTIFGSGAAAWLM